MCEFGLHGACGGYYGAEVLVLLVYGDGDVVYWVGDFAVVFVVQCLVGSSCNVSSVGDLVCCSCGP